MKMAQISEIALFIPKFGTLDLLTEATLSVKKYLSCDVIMTSSANEKGQFLDIFEFFSNFTLLVTLRIPKLILRYQYNYYKLGIWSKWDNDAHD